MLQLVESTDIMSDSSTMEGSTMNESTSGFVPASQNELSRMTKLERKRYREKRRRERVNASFDQLRALLTKIDPQCANRAEISQIELVDRSIKVITDLLDEKGQGAGAGEAPQSIPPPKPQPIQQEPPRAGFFLACYQIGDAPPQYQIQPDYTKTMMTNPSPIKSNQPQVSTQVLTKPMALPSHDQFVTQAPITQIMPSGQVISNQPIAQQPIQLAIPSQVQSTPPTQPPSPQPSSPTSVTISPPENGAPHQVVAPMVALPASAAPKAQPDGLEFYDGILMAMEHETDKEFLDTILSKPEETTVTSNGCLMGSDQPYDPTTDAQGRLAFPPLVDNHAFDNVVFGRKRKHQAV